MTFEGPDASYTRTISTAQTAIPSFSSSASLPDSVVFTATSGGILNITGANGETPTISTTETPAGLGPASDIDSDGTVEVPYVDTGGNVRLVTPDGTETLIADDGSISGQIAHNFTRLAVGTWDGSDPSVFFANENDEDTIYRVASGGSAEEVTTVGDGVDGVIGPADVDGDDTAELVFIDSSQAVQYLEDDGSVQMLYNGAGANNGVGGGSVADYDDDGSAEVAIVDGSNTIRIASASDSDDVYIDAAAVTDSSEPQATKSPATWADVDDDGSPELVYIALDDGNLSYLDNVNDNGNIEIEDLLDDDGDPIPGNEYTGVT